jgi:hypothetical protein
VCHCPRKVYYRDLPAEIQQELWQRLFEAIEPLRLNRKLGAIHFQFAPSITSSGADRKHVEHCAKVMGDLRCLVETLPNHLISEQQNGLGDLFLIPNLFAVFRLMTSSNFVGWPMGRSAGFAPRRILVDEESRPSHCSVKLGKKKAAGRRSAAASSPHF